MVLGFKERFEKPIKKGTKIHTIREDKHDRWRPGVIIHFAKGVRTKNYVNFMMGECFLAQSIEIIRTSDNIAGTIVKIDGRKLTLTEIQKLAWNDGFENLIDFWMWFSQGFKGKIIHWTDFKY